MSRRICAACHWRGGSGPRVSSLESEVRQTHSDVPPNSLHASFGALATQSRRQWHPMPAVACRGSVSPSSEKESPPPADSIFRPQRAGWASFRHRPICSRVPCGRSQSLWVNLHDCPKHERVDGASRSSRHAHAEPWAWHRLCTKTPVCTKTRAAAQKRPPPGESL